MNTAKKKLTRAERKKQQQRRMYIGVAALAVLCVSGVAMMSMLNNEPAASRYTYTTESDIWYVDDGVVEVAAAQAELSPTAAPQATALPAAEPAAAPAQDAAGQDSDGVPSAATELTKITDAPARATDAPGEAQSEPVQAPEPVATQEPVSIMITATGDCTLGTYKKGDGSRSNFKQVVEKLGYDYFFENVRDLFSQDDLTIVNLEGPLTSHNTERPRRIFNFRGYPEYVNILTSGSVEICNLANNHALDYKEEGFKDTYNVLMDAGIGASGYGPEYFTEVKGFTVGSVGFTEWNFEASDILAKVKAARQKCDLLIVSMHWNEEHEYRLSSYCRKMGRALVDAGADIVIGNHSHVYGEIEIYKGKYIINSLGNFVFGGNEDPYVQKCAIFRQEFLMYPDGTVEDGGIDIIPAMISSHKEYNDYQPRIATPEEGKEILYAIAGLSPTMTPENILWLEDSYVIQHGILNAGAQAVTPSPEPTEEPTAAPAEESTQAPAAPEQDPFSAADPEEMPIVQDFAL